MIGLNTSMIPMFLLIVTLIFAGFYLWRRFVALECYIQVLEKKVSNLKKENKDLYGLVNTNDTGFKESDILMNKIFEAPLEKCTSEKCTSDVCHKETEELPPAISVSSSTDLPVSSPTLPVVEHDEDIIIDIIEKDIENESVISENTNIFNRKKLSKMNLDKIKEICTSLNIPTEGTKNSLIDKILSQ